MCEVSLVWLIGGFHCIPCLFVYHCYRFFIQIASDCETVDQASHSMSYISDANILALHRLLWNHQERIGDYLSSSRDHKAVGRRPFDKMATLLAYLGPPEHKPVDSQ